MEKNGKEILWEEWKGDRMRMGRRSYEVYVHISINQEDARKIYPFKMEKFLSVNCDISRACITAEKKGYIIKATRKSSITKI